VEYKVRNGILKGAQLFCVPKLIKNSSLIGGMIYVENHNYAILIFLYLLSYYCVKIFFFSFGMA